jgi:hypothetical protein
LPNITTTTAQVFIPEIWAQQALQVLRSNMVLANLVTRDSDVGAFAQGDTLHIPFPGTFVANDKVPGANVQTQVPTDAEVLVTLSKHKEVTFLIEDVPKVQANQDLMNRYLTNAIVPIAEAIENDLFALYANFTNSVSSASLTGAQVLAGMLQLNKQKVRLPDRSLVISPGSQVKLLSDSNLQSFFAFSEPDAVRNGGIGRAYGFNMFMSQLVPLASTYKNLAFTPDAMILAMRSLPEAGNPGVDQMIVNDPESRLQFRQTVSYNPNALGVQVTLDVLYGVSVLRNLGAAVVLTPSTDG